MLTLLENMHQDQNEQTLSVCAVAGNLSKALDILLRPIADYDCDHFEVFQALHPSREHPINTHPDCIRELLTDPSVNY